MVEPAPNQPTKPKTHKFFLKGFAGLFWDLVGIKTAGDAMTEHALTVEKKGRFLASASIFLIVCVWAGLELRGCYDESTIRNSDDNARTSDDLAKSYKSQLDAANGQLLQTKLDASELGREKDTEIGNLKTENASLKQRLTSYETTHFAELSSNFDTSISNMLGAVSYPEADIILAVNGQTNLEVVVNPIPGSPVAVRNFVFLTNREIFLRVWNKSKYPAIHCGLDFMGDIDPTNLFCDGWLTSCPTAKSGYSPSSLPLYFAPFVNHFGRS